MSFPRLRKAAAARSSASTACATPEDLSAATWAGYKRFTDADGNAVYTYVRRYARFADAEVPAGTVSLTGILQYDAAGDGRYILKLRDENDCTH